MANREIYPSALFPNRGDISAEAAAVSTTVVGIQTIPVSPTTPLIGQSLIAIDDGTGSGGVIWTPESAGDWVMINGIPVSDDYEFSFNVTLSNTNSPAVFINGA